MEIDHDPAECRDCQMEAMAHYAGILEHDSAHSEVTGHDHVSSAIMADAMEYWTPANEIWLALMTDLIAAQRALQALQKPGRLARFLNWVRYWM